MNKNDSIGKYYDNLVERYGDSYRACDYGSVQSQLKKFNIFLNFFKDNNIEVLDVGCGAGDFYRYLQKHFSKANYHGIDLSSKMVAMCKKKYNDNLFEQKNILDYTDKKEYCVANGIFYLIPIKPEEQMKILIEHMFSIATKGIAFNSLSAWALQKEHGEFYADPLKVLQFCYKLTSKIVFRHDYLPHDFTIYMYR